MAGYSAVIDLRVNGLEGLRRVTDSIDTIQKLTKSIKPVPTLFDARNTQALKGYSDEVNRNRVELGKAKRELAEILKAYAEGSVKAVTFAQSIAGLNEQVKIFRQVAANASTSSTEFTNSLKAAEVASNRLVAAELERLQVLNQIYSREAAESGKGPTGMTQNVLQLGDALPNSIAGLRTYAAELDRVFNLVEAGSIDYQNLQREIARVNKEIDVATGQGGMQGPALPPTPGKPAPGSLGFRRGMSTNELEELNKNWTEYLNTLPFQSKEFIAAQRQIGILDVIMGRGGQLGPALPPGFTTKGPTAAAERARQQAISDAGAGRQGPLLPPAVGGGFDLPPSMGRLAPTKLQGLQAFMSKPGMADAVIGGAFPFLFGGGPGAAIGGFAGGLAGGAMGGTLGMALSLGASAFGQKLDQIFGEAIRATQELGSALGNLDATKLRETTILVTAEFENQNRLLLEAGQYEQARAMATKQVAAQTGALGSSTADAANAANLLKNSFDNMMSPVNSLLANLSAPFTAALAGILNIVGLIAKGINVVVSGIGQLLKGATEWLVKLIGGQKTLEFIKNLTGAAKEEQEALRAAAEAEIDAGIRNLQLRKQILGIERDRLEGTNLIARTSQIEADYRIKAAEIQFEKEQKIREINAESAKLTEQQRRIKQQMAEATAQQKLEEAGITKEKSIQRAIIQEMLNDIQSEINLIRSNEQTAQKLNDLEKTKLDNALKRLEVQKQFNQYLNQEIASVNNIQNKKLEIAALERENSIRAADTAARVARLEFEQVTLRYQANELSATQYENEYKMYQNKLKMAATDKQIAEEVYKQSEYIIDIERRQAIVTEYAAEYARDTEKATRALEEQTNAINNRATLLNAISQATQTINNIEIQSLERELERTTSTKRRKEIIEEIYKLEVENAKVQLQATRANIQAELARADAAYRTVQLKYEELKAVVEIAKAEGVITRAHFDALRAQESALRIAKDNLNTAGQVANWQWKAADAVFKAAIEAAKLKKETSGAAEAAGQFAGNMERAAGAISSVSGVLGKETQGAPFAAFGGAMEIQNEGLRKKALDIWNTAQARASAISRSGDVFAGNAELDKARREIAAIRALEMQLAGKAGEKRAKEELQKFTEALSAANMAIPYFLSRTLGISPSAAKVAATTSAPSAAPAAAPIPLTAPLASGLSTQPSGGPGIAIIDKFPTINLQTGPVLQQDNGEKYVSLKDLEGILQDFAATIFENSRTSGGRRYQGVS